MEQTKTLSYDEFLFSRHIEYCKLNEISKKDISFYEYVKLYLEWVR